MGFGRRKSSQNVDEAPPVTAQEEAEARRRNRLSKPLTNKSSTNLLLLVPDQESKSNNVSTEALESSCLLDLADEDRRQQIRAHVFDIDRDNAPLPIAAKHSSMNGVASLVSKFESQSLNNSSQQSLLSPTKPKRPFSDLFSSRRSSGQIGQSRPSLISSNSKDRMTVLKDKSSSPSPNVSTEQIVDVPSIPTSRKASYIPGTATRKSSGYTSEVEDIPRIETSHVEEPDLERDDLSDALSFDEGDDEDWLPPPQNPRPVTPASLDYTHLGGLRLGSLQVVNGRASPAASEMSKHLLSARMAALRDTSSDYGDADSDTVQRRKASSDNKRTTLMHSREVSWYSRGSSNLHKVETIEVRSVSIASIEPRDLASAMAAEYIAELPASPYAVGNRSPESLSNERIAELPASPTTIKGRVSDRSLRTSIQVQKRTSPELQRTTSVYSTASIHSEEGALERSSSPVPSEQSSTGSVLHITTKRTEFDDELFDDETIGPSPEPDRETIDSFYSWQSPVDLDHPRNEVFESALEFPVHGTPQRIQSRETLEPPKRFEKSDSGYSSNNSVRSSSGERAVGAATQPVPVVMSEIRHTVSTPVPTVSEQRGTASKFFRPILKSRKTAPVVPTFENLQPTPAPSILSAATSIADTDKPKRKKLQKKGFFKQKKGITVTNVQSIDDLTIPPVPPASLANLRIRSQQVPELEKTFKSEHHVNNQASMSNMNLPIQEIRFPSPPPELAPPEKPAKTRRRSWFGLTKEEKSRAPVRSQLSQHDAIAVINDFGTVTSSLGGNPYDVAQVTNRSRQPSRTSINPHNISSREPRPKSFMDDQTAAEVARLRSSSIRERDSWQQNNSRKPSFNDRGGIPGKNLRPTSVAYDAPPLPPLPTQQTWQNQWTHEEEEIPPPPPPHSPRPSFIEPADDFETTSLAPPPPPSHSPPPPPPPSHSPRPMETNHDPWAAQAAAWQARRQTADNTMKRQSWHADVHDEQAIEAEEPLYPSLPPRRNETIQRRAQNYTQTRHYSFQPGVGGYDYDFQPHDTQVYDSNYMQSYSHHSTYQSHHPSYQYQFHTQPYDGSDPEQNAPRALPHVSRPASRAGSHRSFASSLAEELHPELDDSRPAGPKNDFGRYSGGLQYGFQKSHGFGGSAGTRTVSGRAAAGYKGMALREGYGVDLGDVPVMGMVKKVELATTGPPSLPMVNFR